MPTRYTEQFSESHTLLDQIFPVSTSTQVNGNYVSLKHFQRAVAKFSVGAIAVGGTLTFQVRQAQDTSGTGVKALKAATAITDAGDNQHVWIEIRTEELDVDGGFDCVRIEAVAGTAASVVYAELIGFVSRFEPVAESNVTVVTVS
jgi:hypothetical protein